jgi:hypothetical protein
MKEPFDYTLAGFMLPTLAVQYAARVGYQGFNPEE